VLTALDEKSSKVVVVEVVVDLKNFIHLLHVARRRNPNCVVLERESNRVVIRSLHIVRFAVDKTIICLSEAKNILLVEKLKRPDASLVLGDCSGTPTHYG
jgi:hypothetical protein